MTSHSKLPPSSAARRVACPGSRALEEKYPETEESPYSREGNIAHWVASDMLGKPTTPPNDEMITQEMEDGAELYVNHISNVLDLVGKKYRVQLTFDTLRIEERIDIKRIHPECWGTPDAWFYRGDELHIFDYKYGNGYIRFSKIGN